MSDSSEFDVARAHKFFSADCFNRAWDLIIKADRTAEEDEQLRSVCHASLWHWTQRSDCTPKNLSIGYWLLSRVYALLGQGSDAKRYGELSLLHGRNEAPFYLGYAHEALARAALISGHSQSLSQHLAAARRYAEQVTDPEDRAALEKDLETVRTP